ncbi:hypothetical protein [Kitasatospora sp. MBT63]|uniref:hypothetical protein n=1 Tax=Kitasatospora sp. MBT63 TaxID=1444768 RepID=UPI00068C142A|nr:hypothetical protein [Kitasatospora sp. MBT63]
MKVLSVRSATVVASAAVLIAGTAARVSADAPTVPAAFGSTIVVNNGDGNVTNVGGNNNAAGHDTTIGNNNTTGTGHISGTGHTVGATGPVTSPSATMLVGDGVIQSSNLATVPVTVTCTPGYTIQRVNVDLPDFDAGAHTVQVNAPCTGRPQIFDLRVFGPNPLTPGPTEADPGSYIPQTSPGSLPANFPPSLDTDPNPQTITLTNS